MKCPVDDNNLVRGKYAGANVHECGQCNGALLTTVRAGKIERRINKNTERLVEELSESDAADTQEAVRCPKCRAEMKKRFVKQIDISIDDCRQCGMSWFDGGELAALQLAFESDPQTVELNQMRKRLNSMTDVERAEYETNINKLQDLGSPLGQAVRGATFQLTARYCLSWFR